jgi:hypothetical protein
MRCRIRCFLVSEPAIVAGLAVATLGQRTRTDWLRLVEDYDRIRDLVARDSRLRKSEQESPAQGRVLSAERGAAQRLQNGDGQGEFY